MASPETQASPARHASVSAYRIISRLLLAITVLLAAALTGMGLAALSHRHQVLASALHATEAAVSTAIGVPLTIGSVKGPYWNGLELRDVKVYGWKGPGAPVIATLPRVTARYSLLEVLRLGKQPILITAHDPTLALSRDARGRLNYRPEFPPPSGPAGKFPDLPRLQITVKGGTVAWSDEAQPGTRHFQGRYSLDGAHASLVKKVLRYDLLGHEGPMRIALGGELNLETLQGSVRAGLRDAPTARYFAYLAPNPLITYTGGKADTAVTVSWAQADPKAIEIAGTFGLTELSLLAEGVRRPIEHVQATGRFDGHTAWVELIKGQLCGQVFTGQGQVLGLDHPVQDLRFTGQATQIQLASLVPLVPDLAAWNLSGEAFATAEVTGTTVHPLVSAQVSVPEGHVVGQIARNVTATVRVEDLDVDIPVFEGRLNDGLVQGNGALTLAEDPALSFDAQWAEVDLEGTLARYMTRLPPASGRLAGTVTVRGSAMHPAVDGMLRLEQGRYQRARLTAARGHFHYEAGHWRVDQARAEADGGTLLAEAAGTDAGEMGGTFRLAGFSLAKLGEWGLAAPVAGTLAASGSFNGSWQDFTAWQGTGTAVVEDGAVADQPVERVAAHLSLFGQTLRVEQLHARAGDGAVDGNLELAFASQPIRLSSDFNVQRLHLERIPALQEALRAQIGGLAGTVSATGSVELAHNAWSGFGELAAVGLDSERIGRLDSVSGPVRFDNMRLASSGLALRMANGPEATLRGSVDFAARKPIADWELSLRDAKVKTALSNFHWAQLLSGTWIAKPLGLSNVKGPSKPIAELSALGDNPASGSLPLKQILAHWQRYQLEPLETTPTDRHAYDPFWEAVDGTLNLDVSAQGPLEAPEMRLRARLANGVAWGHPLSRATLTAVWRDQTLRIPVLELIEAGGVGTSLSARGTLGPDGNLEIYGNRVDLSWLNPYLVPWETQLSGLGSFTLLATGDPADPKLNITAEVEKGSFTPGRGPASAANRFDYDLAAAKATYHRGRLTIDDARVVTDNREAHIIGNLPVLPALAATNSLQLSIDLQGESLGVVTALTRGEIQWKGGPGTVHVELGGTLEQPALSGFVDLRGVRFHERALQDDITDVRAYATINSEAITVQRAVAQYGGGNLVLTGQILLNRFVPDRLRLQGLVRQVNAELSSGLFKGTVEAALEINGTVFHPLIGGTAAISNSTIDLDALYEPDGTSPGAGSGPAPIVLGLQDLTARVHQGVRVLGQKLPVTAVAGGRLLDVIVDGNLLINGPLTDPDAKGLINVRSGTFTPLIYAFDIVSGSVEFLGAGVKPEAETGFEDLLPSLSAASTKSKLANTRINIVAQAQVYSYNKADFRDKVANKNGGMLDVRATLTGSLANMERKFECPANPELSNERIERILGKEDMVTNLLKPNSSGEAGLDPGTVLVNEAGGMVSTYSRRFLNQFTRPVQDALQLDALGFDLVAADQLQSDTTTATFLGLAPSFYTETRKLFGNLTVSGRYTFRTERNIYQLGLNWRLSDAWSAQLGTDNRNLKGQNQNPQNWDFNPSLNLVYHIDW